MNINIHNPIFNNITIEMACDDIILTNIDIMHIQYLLQHSKLIEEYKLYFLLGSNLKQHIQLLRYMYFTYKAHMQEQKSILNNIKQFCHREKIDLICNDIPIRDNILFLILGLSSFFSSYIGQFKDFPTLSGLFQEKCNKEFYQKNATYHYTYKDNGSIITITNQENKKLSDVFTKINKGQSIHINNKNLTLLDKKVTLSSATYYTVYILEVSMPYSEVILYADSGDINMILHDLKGKYKGPNIKVISEFTQDQQEKNILEYVKYRNVNCIEVDENTTIILLLFNIEQKIQEPPVLQYNKRHFQLFFQYFGQLL